MPHIKNLVKKDLRKDFDLLNIDSRLSSISDQKKRQEVRDELKYNMDTLDISSSLF